jgi:hypothetical protein
MDCAGDCGWGGWWVDGRAGLVVGVKGHSAIYNTYCQVALYSLAGQFRLSKALVRNDTPDPKADNEGQKP